MLNVNRRSLLQQALLLVGAAAMPGGVEALAATAKSPKRQLDAARYDSLSALADTIVPRTGTPGAVDVGVPQLVDAMLGTWASPARRTALTAAIDKIDAAAKARHGKAFGELSASERTALLQPYDVAALKPLAPDAPTPDAPSTVTTGSTQTTVDPQAGRPRQATGSTILEKMEPRVADPAYARLKELIVVGYYYTEAALTNELRYEHDPGVWEPSIPITPETRPWGGNALI